MRYEITKMMGGVIGERDSETSGIRDFTEKRSQRHRYQDRLYFENLYIAALSTIAVMRLRSVETKQYVS